MSTTTGLVGIFVAIVGAALAQLLFSEASRPGLLQIESSRTRTGILGVLLAIDLWGVGFPLYTLYLNTVQDISGALLHLVLISSLIVLFANVLLPFSIVNALRSLKDIQQWARINSLDDAASIAAMRVALVDKGYLSAADFDQVTNELFKTGAASGPATDRMIRAIFQATFLGRPGKFGLSVSRTLAYYLIVWPVLARLLRGGALVFKPGRGPSEFPRDDDKTPRRDTDGDALPVEET